METMRSKLMSRFTASAAAILFSFTMQTVWAQGEASLTGTVSSEAEGNMEGAVVTAAQPGSIVRVSVTTDAQGRYAFPQNRLVPGEYTLSIRAVGYDIDARPRQPWRPRRPPRPTSSSRRPRTLRA